MCAYCSGSSGAESFVDDHLGIEWKSVLHVCQPCRTEGALPIAKFERRNGAQNERRAQRARQTAHASSEIPTSAHGESLVTTTHATLAPTTTT